MPAKADFDVAVVGASIAGCTAARLFGLAGAHVALVERSPDPAAYKVVCTHAIQSSAVPTIARLGVLAQLEARGAVRAENAAWTPHGGWIPFPADAPRALCVTRRTLDPMLRELAAGTPGVELLLGRPVVGLLDEHGHPAGVEVETSARRRLAIRARLVVAADGRGSTVARLARVPGRVRPHNRFFYFAYWRGVRPRSRKARLWFLDPDGGALFPNEDDLTVAVAGPHRDRLPEFRRDPEGAYRREIARLSDGAHVLDAERVSKLIGKLEMPNVMRPAARPGLAFVGDAALATDPIFGVGCGWAFQSAEWLVDHASDTLLSGGDLDAALGRYRRAFWRRLAPDHWVIADLSTGRRFRWSERMTFRAAIRDPVVARAVEEVGSRRRSALRMLDPRLAPRLLRHGQPGRGGSAAQLDALAELPAARLLLGRGVDGRR